MGILTTGNLLEVPDFLLGKYREDRQPHVPKEQIHSWGYIDRTGKEVIPTQFRAAAEFHQGIARVDVSTSTLKFNEDIRFINQSGKFLHPSEVPPQLTIHRKFPMSWDFHEGLATFKDTAAKKYGFVDSVGEIAIPAKFDEAYILESGFYEGLSAVKHNGKWGFIDKAGSFSIPPRFESARQFHDGMAAVKLSKSDLANKHLSTPSSRWTFVDRSGRLWDRVFVNVPDFAEGFTAAEIAEPQMILNTPEEVENIQNLPLHMQVFTTNGKPLLATIFDDVGQSSEGMIPIRRGKLQYIDFKMCLLAGNSRFHDGFALVRSGDQYGYLNKIGAWLVKPTYDRAEPFSQGLAAVCRLARVDAQTTPPKK